MRILEAELAVAQRAPSIKASLLAKLRSEARAEAAEMRAILAEPKDAGAARDVLRALFPGGLVLYATLNKENRRAWTVRGTARLDFLTLSSDPTVSPRKVRNFSQEIRYITTRAPSRRRDRSRAST